MAKLIVANWKSHKNFEEAKKWLTLYQGSPAIQKMINTEVAIAPSFQFLQLVAESIRALMQTKVAVQDLSPFPAGAYTGAVAASALNGLAVRYAIVGHSERRRYFRETHQEVANKVDQAIQAGINPIVCVDRDDIRMQAAAIADEQLDKCIVAYEPLAAIGTGIDQPLDEVREAVTAITTAFGKVPILYGGSVKAENVLNYLEVTDGVLVATHSLDISDFLTLVKRVVSHTDQK